MSTMDTVVQCVALLAGLSVASERFVEIAKQSFPSLNQETSDPASEGRRRAILQTLAVVAGVLTATLAYKGELFPDGFVLRGVWAVPIVGLLVSGGSGFWNAVLTYTTSVKELKEAQVAQLRPNPR
jgi:hypothetical protein